MVGLKISPQPWRLDGDTHKPAIVDGAHGTVAEEVRLNNALMAAHAVNHYDSIRGALAELIEFVVTCEVQHPALRDAKQVMTKVRNAEDKVRQLSRNDS